MDLQLEEVWSDHAIRSTVATTKLGSDILKKNNNKKEKCDFLIFIYLDSFDFLA